MPQPENPKVTLPLYETDGVKVSLNKDKTMAKFEDENGDTPVAVEIATKLLDKNIKMLKVEKVNEKILEFKNKDYVAYEITFVNKDGLPVSVNGEAKVRVPVGKEVDKAYYITSDTKKIVNEVSFEKGTDNTVYLNVKHFSLYAVTFKTVATSQPVNPGNVNTQSSNQQQTQSGKPDSNEGQGSSGKSLNPVKQEKNVENQSEKVEKTTSSDSKEKLPSTGSVSSLSEMITAGIALLGGVFISKKRKNKI